MWICAVLLLASSPDQNVRDALVRAKSELRGGGQASAITVTDLTAIIATLPESAKNLPPVLQVLALCHTSRGEAAEAVPYMRRAIKLAPSAPGMVGLMITLAQQEPAREAEQLLEMALKMQPSGALAARAYHQLGAVLEAPREGADDTASDDIRARARAAYESSLRVAAEAKQPQNVETLAALSLSLSTLAAKSDPDTETQHQTPGDAPDARATSLARQAIALEPKLPVGHVALGRALISAQPNVTALDKKVRKEAVGALRTALGEYATLAAVGQSAGASTGLADEAFVHHLLGTLLAAAPKVSDARVTEAKTSLEKAAALQPHVAHYTESVARLHEAIEKRAADIAFEEELLMKWEGPEMNRMQVEGEAHQAVAEHALQEEAPRSPRPPDVTLLAAGDAIAEAPATGHNSSWDALRDQGVVTIDGMLEPAHAAALLDEVNSQVQAAVDASASDKELPVEFFSRIAARIRRLDYKLALTPTVHTRLAIVLRKLAPTLEAALGSNPKLFELAAIVVDDGAPPQPYHADLRPGVWEHGDSAGGSAMPSASVYVALQDVSPTMGPTVFLPRTNTKEAHAAFYADDEYADTPPPDTPEASTISPSRERLLRTTPVRRGEMAAGSATIFDQRLLHAGSGNTAGGRRVLLCLSFMREGVVGPSGSLRAEYEGHTLRGLIALETAAGHDEP